MLNIPKYVNRNHKTMLKFICFLDKIKIYICTQFLEVKYYLKIWKLNLQFFTNYWGKKCSLSSWKPPAKKINFFNKLVRWLIFPELFYWYSLFDIVTCKHMSRINIWCRVFRLEVTQDIYLKEEERTSFNSDVIKTSHLPAP